MINFLIKIRHVSQYGKNKAVLTEIWRNYKKEQNENKEKRYSNSNNYFSKSFVFGTSIVSYVTYNLLESRVYAESPIEENVGKVRNNLPYYTIEQIAEHTTPEKRIWVTYKEGVYDITDFVVGHPGGEQILLAAGNSVEPFWVLYAVHQNPHVYQILETLRIGNLSKEDSKKMTEDMTDPYSTDPKRHPLLIPASVKPFNAEAPPALLVDSFITPNELFYVRNHLPVPQIDPDEYELEVEIEATGEVLTLTLDDLKKMPKHTITATIMCAGNRRSEMTKIKPVKGLDWGPAAVGNAKWTGVRLRDVLKMTKLDEDDNENNKHVQFEGIDLDATGSTYGASIPFWRAIDRRGDVLLAYEMNGAPIPRDHGFPVRVIVPGVVGARNVKWLGRVVVARAESGSHWQQNDYKGFGPSTDWDTADFGAAPAIQELPVISAACRPAPGEAVARDGLVVRGYAWSGGGQRIVRVDVTADGGASWHVAELEQDGAEPPQHWSWSLWTCRVPVEEGKEEVEIWVKAVDSCYNTQPESFKNIWNLRGVLSNAYHKINVKIK